MKTLIIVFLIVALVMLILKKQGASKLESKSSYEKTSTNTFDQKTPSSNSEPYEWKDYNPITQEEFKAAFKAEGLGDKWSYFNTQLKPEIRIKPKHMNESLIEIGQSKIGGNPDLPSDVNWPIQKNGKKTCFFLSNKFQRN